MSARCRLAGTAVLLVFALLRQAGAVHLARAQVPPGSSEISLSVGTSTDGQALVVTWTVGAFARNSDSFALFRRSATTPPGFAVQIASLTGELRAFTDYGVGAVGIWCYQLVAIKNGVYTFASLESCAAFLPSLPGTSLPVIAAGCNQFYQTQPAGTAMSAVAARFNPRSAVTSIWRYDPDQARLTAGYFADQTAPTDFDVLPATREFEFVCLTTSATFG